MKRVVLASLLLGLGLAIAWSGASAGDEPKDKVQTIGKGGLKISAKITDDSKKFDFAIEVGGKEITLPMQAKPYAVKLEAGKKYTITMDTDDDIFDPFVVLQDGAGKTVGFDDDGGGKDGGGKLNAKLVFTPKKDGTFKVFAAALKGTGPYTLKIVATGGAAPPVEPKKALTVGKDGLKIKGTLSEDTRKIDYQVKMQAGKTYRIDLKGGDFDAFLFLFNADGKKLAEDDDGGDGFNSRIIHKADVGGTYRITATSLGMRGTGDYVLEVREEE